MSLRLSLHVIVHTLLFYNIPRTYLCVCVESNDPYRVQFTITFLLYYTQRELFRWMLDQRKKESCECIVSSSFLLPRKSFFPPEASFFNSRRSFSICLFFFFFVFKAERWSRSTSNVNVRICVQADYGLGYGLYWPTRCSNVDSRNGRMHDAYSLVGVR